MHYRIMLIFASFALLMAGLFALCSHLGQPFVLPCAGSLALSVLWAKFVGDRHREREKRLGIFRKFIDGARQALGMADLDGTVTYANAALCRMLGENIVGKNVIQYYPEEYKEKLIQEIILQVIEKGEWTGELPLQSTEKKSQQMSIQERCFRFLQKPYTIARLLKAIKEVIEKGA